MRISDWSSDVCSSDLPDSRREILLVAAFYGRARKATAQFYPAMATHFEGVWRHAPILNEAERTPKSLCRVIRFHHGKTNLRCTARRCPAFARQVTSASAATTTLCVIYDTDADMPCHQPRLIGWEYHSRYKVT